MSYEIRRAGHLDLPALESFEQGIIAYERRFDETLRPDPISYYDITELVESQDAEVVVAEHEGAVVGSGYAKRTASLSYSFPNDHAFLGMMFVLPEHRGKGINGQILGALLDWAKRHELTEIRLTVYPGNESALNAYLKAGFVPHLLEMRMNQS